MKSDKSFGSFPFCLEDIILKKRKIKSELLLNNHDFKPIRIAFLSGSTINEIADELELFLLSIGYKPEYYFSMYGNYYLEGAFYNEKLKKFAPNLIFVHFSYRNIVDPPSPLDTKEDVERKLELNKGRIEQLLSFLIKEYKCPIIINNYDYCSYRLFGNKDCYDYRGLNNFIHNLNSHLSQFANDNCGIYINDLNYLQAKYGIDSFSDPKYWYLYKYALNVKYIPFFVFNLFNIIKSLLGKNKKVINVDLDNTLWGGVIGDDGLEAIKLGQGNPEGEYYHEFQKYLKGLKEMGVLLTINSKNELVVAIEGLNHPDTILKKEDFVVIKANWNNKSSNVLDTANELNLGVDSFVFVDDNPAERLNVASLNQKIEILNFDENAIRELDFMSFFEPTILTDEDKNKTEMYIQNKNREDERKKYVNYSEYLQSLNMVAKIGFINDAYFDRALQLINKTNQFNLTYHRVTKETFLSLCQNKSNICIYSKLTDKFGDNGLVSCIVGVKLSESTLVIDNFVMSCRVFSRGLEDVLFDCFMKQSLSRGFKKIVGIYSPKEKNRLVSSFYTSKGFKLISKSENEIKYEINVEDYCSSKQYIKVIEDKKDAKEEI